MQGAQKVEPLGVYFHTLSGALCSATQQLSVFKQPTGNILSIIKKAALYFARKEYCRAAIDEHADLSIFKEKLTATVITGLILIFISYLLGIPAVFIVGAIAAWLKSPAFGVIGIPLIYGISWLLLMLGIYLAGPQYGKALSRWTVRVVLEKILGDEAGTAGSAHRKDSKNNTIKN